LTGPRSTWRGACWGARCWREGFRESAWQRQAWSCCDEAARCAAPASPRRRAAAALRLSRAGCPGRRSSQPGPALRPRSQAWSTPVAQNARATTE
jgi:hypothetical protein